MARHFSPPDIGPTRLGAHRHALLCSHDRTSAGIISVPGVPGHAELESWGIHQGHTATTVANLMEPTMTWTNRITLAATLIVGAIALMTYAQAITLPAHFA